MHSAAAPDVEQKRPSQHSLPPQRNTGWKVKEIGAEVLVSACPWCKNNFAQAVKEDGNGVKVMDFSELILASLDA